MECHETTDTGSAGLMVRQGRTTGHERNIGGADGARERAQGRLIGGRKNGDKEVGTCEVQGQMGGARLTGGWIFQEIGVVHEREDLWAFAASEGGGENGGSETRNKVGGHKIAEGLDDLPEIRDRFLAELLGVADVAENDLLKRAAAIRQRCQVDIPFHVCRT